MISLGSRSERKEITVSKRGDRFNIFCIQRIKNDHGFHVYKLENKAESRQILIPRFVFGRFRAYVKKLLKDEASNSVEVFEHRVSFLNKDYFFFKSSYTDLDNLIIQDLEERKGSSGYITVSRKCLKVLNQLLYNEKLQHPNDVLEGIISYHKLFQFSFVKTSKSITSDLILRKDVLQGIDEYRPVLVTRTHSNLKRKSENISSEKSYSGKSSSDKKNQSISNFQSKLGERLYDKDIKVDYSQLFDDKSIKLSTSCNSSDKHSNNTTPLYHFVIPLSAREVKDYESERFYYELDREESIRFRNQFLCDRSNEFYLGFEIIDALFTQNKILKTFQFPLYYLKVQIRESGRGVRLMARDDGRFYLNHLALAQLIVKFGRKTAGQDSLEQFFTNLLAQHISVDQLNDRITLTRHLPVSEDIFERTREILIGYQEENGKGGILADLRLKGVECDLHKVVLYRARENLSPIELSLEYDLDKIHEIAHHSVSRFYNSLLGRFLTPELLNEIPQEAAKVPPVWVPGRLSRSISHLLKKLNQHDIVLLEGPPGTGKTFTIMNLLIDFVCRNKRVLIVSDQRAAIEALIEKIHMYLCGGHKDKVVKHANSELLSSAIKVVFDLPDFDQNLSEVINGLRKAFNVINAGTPTTRQELDKKLEHIDNKILFLIKKITVSMHQQMGEGIDFYFREPHKTDNSADVEAMEKFVALLLEKDHKKTRLIDSFVTNRIELALNSMRSCYSYFRPPEKICLEDFALLRKDAQLLANLSNKYPTTDEEVKSLIVAMPFHEIAQYLQEVYAQQTAVVKTSITKFTSVFSYRKRSLLQITAGKLLRMVNDQIVLLEQLQNWPDEVRDILQNMHEYIRLADRPDRALTFYQRMKQITSSRSGVMATPVQRDLESIDDLMTQRDKLVYECFVGKLHDICKRATETRRRIGTNATTSIMALAENLQQFKSLEESGDVFDEFRQALYETFPIWIARKQMVSLMLPCEEKSFDLVIIDEATQCRVDDALPLMFRANKILVVGDDKQTVLQKDSPIDDYLFKDHELDEHLRSTQARGFKGGGSNIFSLIKYIKQASVMLDEHYRCPTEIIEFSNRYVYNNELNVMQWSLLDQNSAVEIHDAEKDAIPEKKQTSGKYKGIETAMLDRFLDYVTDAVHKIEKDTGSKINVETDAAICYFLLKNEPYVSYAVNGFLNKLNRGNHILHGAGAALQGKERDYIFYFWDITRYNLGAFAQGDDESKRRGELNVLMSRPRKKAFHYLHHDFLQLNHSRTSITRYLSRALNNQEQTAASADNQKELLTLHGRLLRLALSHTNQRGMMNIKQKLSTGHLQFRENIVVGDEFKSVDLVAYSTGSPARVVGVVDLSGFHMTEDVGKDIVDYYFLLKRAQPKIHPVFMFPYEIVDENGHAFRSLIGKLENI
jgi:DNA polymerase III delta prime subunit